MAVIAIGPGAIGRDSAMGNLTFLAKDGPADGTGLIDTFKLWFNAPGTTVKVGTFYGSSNSYTCRGSHTVGAVAAGSQQPFTGLEVEVELGDFAGVWVDDGTIDCYASGGLGMWYKTGDQFGEGTVEYTWQVDYIISIEGSGETTPEAVGHSRAFVIG